MILRRRVASSWIAVIALWRGLVTILEAYTAVPWAAVVLAMVALLRFLSPRAEELFHLARTLELEDGPALGNAAVRERLTLPKASPAVMPPRRVGELPDWAITRVLDYLRERCSVPGACR